MSNNRVAVMCKLPVSTVLLESGGAVLLLQTLLLMLLAAVHCYCAVLLFSGHKGDTVCGCG